MSFWSDEQIKYLQQHINIGSAERYQNYINKFGANRTLDAVERQVRRLRAASQAQALIESTIREDDEPELEIEVVTPEEQLLREALGQAIRNQGMSHKKDREDFKLFIDRLIDESRKVQFSKVIPVKTGSTLIIALSDTHIGKQTENFNSQVFQDRLLSIPDKIKQEIAFPSDLTEIVLVLAGDMLEGEDIYQTQSHHLEMPVIDQTQIAISTFWKLAIKLRDVLCLPVRIVTCPGNHGRVSKTAAEKSNWDNVIYQTLGFIAATAQQDNIQVDVNFNNFYLFPVQDKQVAIYHYGVKHMGTPAMQAKVAGWLYTKEFDLLIHGHWHHWSIDNQFGKPVMKNGSLPGDDDLSERMGVFDPPRQGWVLVRKGQPINMFGFLEW